MKIEIPVSVGELLDKITILQIKCNYSTSDFIHKELETLMTIAEDNNLYKFDYIDELYNVNKILWEIEADLRVREKNNDFGNDFIQSARSVYQYNDLRAEIKEKINQETNSTYKEIKIYE